MENPARNFADTLRGKPARNFVDTPLGNPRACNAQALQPSGGVAGCGAAGEPFQPYACIAALRPSTAALTIPPA